MFAFDGEEVKPTKEVSMHITWSEKKGIPVIHKGDSYINFTSDEDIQWVLVSGKVRNTKVGVTEHIGNMVNLSSLKATSIPRELRKDFGKEEVKAIREAVSKRLSKRGTLNRKYLKETIDEIESKLREE